MNLLIYVSCITVTTFFYLLFSDGTSLDFIQKMIDNVVEVAVVIGLMSSIGWLMLYIFNNIKFCHKENNEILNTKIESLYNDEPLDFCIECKDEDSKKNNNYCQSVINLYSLVEETSKNISYKSIAVTGEWGSGKSSILYGLKNLLEKKYESYVVIHINVWKYKETSQIITALENQLNNKFPNDSFFIKSYFELIASWYEKECFLKNILPTESQEEFEQRITKQLLNKRLIVMIDEIDRIVDKSELMEILKLIKVHSNIKKTTIITAISQKHFLQTMGEIDPKYLQKYFYYTFPVPSFSKKDLLNHTYQILTEWDISENSNYLSDAHAILRYNKYFSEEIWEYIPTHREAKLMLTLFKQRLENALRNHKIVQKKKIVETYSVVFFYLALLHTTNLSLFLQLDEIDEKENNEIILKILKQVSLSDFKHMLNEFKGRAVIYGNHPWFVLQYYIDNINNDNYAENFKEFYQKGTDVEYEHISMLLSNISFEQLEKIKEFIPLMDSPKMIYDAISKFNRHEDFKQLLISSFVLIWDKNRIKKISNFLSSIDDNNLEEWKSLKWDNFLNLIIQDIGNENFNGEIFDTLNLSSSRKDELRELIRPYFEKDIKKWKLIERMTEQTFIVGEN